MTIKYKYLKPNTPPEKMPVHVKNIQDFFMGRSFKGDFICITKPEWEMICPVDINSVEVSAE